MTERTMLRSYIRVASVMVGPFQQRKYALYCQMKRYGNRKHEMKCILFISVLL